MILVYYVLDLSFTEGFQRTYAGAKTAGVLHKSRHGIWGSGWDEMKRVPEA